MRLEKLLTEGSFQFRVGDLQRRRVLVYVEYLTHQRIAICVQSAGRQAENNVTRSDGTAVEYFCLFYHADYEASEVVVIAVVYSRHFSSFAADEGTADIFTGVC